MFFILIVNVNKTKNVSSAIRIVLSGKAWCIWSEGGQGATFTGKEEYFKTSTFLMPNTFSSKYIFKVDKEMIYLCSGFDQTMDLNFRPGTIRTTLHVLCPKCCHHHSRDTTDTFAIRLK